MAVEAEAVEARVEVDLREAGQGCLYVVLLLRLRRMETRPDRVEIGGWFSAWGCNGAEQGLIGGLNRWVYVLDFFLCRWAGLGRVRDGLVNELR